MGSSYCERTMLQTIIQKKFHTTCYMALTCKKSFAKSQTIMPFDTIKGLFTKILKKEKSDTLKSTDGAKTGSVLFAHPTAVSITCLHLCIATFS